METEIWLDWVSDESPSIRWTSALDPVVTSAFIVPAVGETVFARHNSKQAVNVLRADRVVDVRHFIVDKNETPGLPPKWLQEIHVLLEEIKGQDYPKAEDFAPR